MRYSVLDEHRGYLSDLTRLSIYRRAIGEKVKPGSVVLDLGAGTGILGLMSCQAGARRVYSIEIDPIISIARDLSRANGFEDRFHFIRGLSTEVDLPEKVDAVVCDQIGSLGYEAGILEYMPDASQRFLKPGGSLIPGALRFQSAPIEDPDLHHEVDFWNNSRTGFNLRPVHQLGTNSTYARQLRRETLLGKPVEIGRADLSATPDRSLRMEGTTVIERPGVLHGMGCWFEVELSPGIVMTNSPAAETPIQRSQVFLPIEREVFVDTGDRVRIRVQVIHSEMLVNWNVVALTADGREKASFAHSTFHGMTLTKEDLLKTHPHSTPTLSPKGQARLTILSLCDGAHSLAEIEKETYQNHPTVFRSAVQAASFVAEIVGRYAK